MYESSGRNRNRMLLIKVAANFFSIFTPAFQITYGTIFRKNKERINQGNYDLDIVRHLFQLGFACLAFWGDAVTDGVLVLSIIGKEPDSLPPEVEVGTAVIKLGLVGAALLSRRK